VTQKSSKIKALDILKNRFHSAFSTSQALECGVHPRDLYSLRDGGLIEQVSRGLYKVIEVNVENLDLLVVSHRSPNAVICLESALSFHEITTQIPRSVNIALPKGAKKPKIEHPPVTVFHFSEAAFSSGIEEYEVNNEKVRIYTPEKTLADCFKFRNKLGMDIVLEALKMYKEKYRFDGPKLMTFSRICRVSKIIQPYVESLLP
jgi:predicted transcriptional regulator of viral defense system